jgi:hypothetical protein
VTKAGTEATANNELQDKDNITTEELEELESKEVAL